MPVEVTRTSAAVGCSSAGSGTVSTRTSRLPCQATAFIALLSGRTPPGAVPRVPGTRDCGGETYDRGLQGVLEGGLGYPYQSELSRWEGEEDGSRKEGRCLRAQLERQLVQTIFVGSQQGAASNRHLGRTARFEQAKLSVPCRIPAAGSRGIAVRGRGLAPPGRGPAQRQPERPRQGRRRQRGEWRRERRQERRRPGGHRRRGCGGGHARRAPPPAAAQGARDSAPGYPEWRRPRQGDPQGRRAVRSPRQRGQDHPKEGGGHRQGDLVTTLRPARHG